MPGNVCYVPELGGYQEVIAVAAPAVQTDWAYEVPAGSEMYFDSIMFRFAADGNAANRQLRAYMYGPDNFDIYRLWFTTVVTAGQTVTVSLWVGNSRTDDLTTTNYSDALPDMRLPALSDVGSAITNMQVGDQISDVRLNVTRWKVV